jgi:outer membrane protein OmpA-like peptidoglycan-associated protein
MEVHFGHHFANIRIHDDSVAAQSARSVDARAYTVGRDIVFDAGLYAPDTRAGRHLLAHELAHVVQQSRGGSGLRPKSAQLRVSPPDDEFEREADQAANELTAGSLASAIHSAPSLLQRAPCPSAPTQLGDVPLDPDSDCTQPLASASGQRFLFCRDSDVMTDQAETELTALLSMLLTMPRIELHGFASPEGPAGREAPYNLNLSCRRAKRVFDFLVAAGVPASRMEVFKHGGTSTFGSRPQNRAVVIPIEGGPVSAGPVPNRLRVAAVSFLACAGCNPFTDDGSLALSPPATEPPIGTSYRMKHWIEAEIASRNLIHIEPGSARIIDSGHAVGTSGYCGTTAPGHVIRAVGPTPPVALSDPVHGDGLQWESEYVTQVGVTVPCTLPGAPCGPLGTSPLIPPIHNRFRLRIFADGTGEGEFVSASLMPLHYLYERGALKMFGGTPVHPAVDLATWSTSTGVPLIAAQTGLKALRHACCHHGRAGGVRGCMCICDGGVSDVPSIPGMDPNNAMLACLGAGAGIAAASCPTPCAPSGTVCTLPVMPSNP